jgi:NADPH2:quinone reductase
VLVQGALGAVGSLAAQLAHWGGATVIGTVTRHADLDGLGAAVTHRVALDDEKPAEAIRAHAPDGVHRIIEVSFSDNADLDAAVAAPGAVIAAYATRHERPDLPFWPMLFANLTIRLLGSDDFPREAVRQAATDLTTAAQDGALAIPIGEPLPLQQIAEAHERVDAGSRKRVLLSIPQSQTRESGRRIGDATRE